MSPKHPSQPSGTPTDPAPDATTITRYLQAWSDGDSAAREQLFERVYDQLSQMAANRLRSERDGLTLETRDLVHEAFLRLVDQRRVRWQDRAHFFNIAARIMRRILVDHARRSSSLKRGGDFEFNPLDEVSLDVASLDAASLDATSSGPAAGAPNLIDLHRALDELEKQDAKLAQIVLLRVFAGLTQDEAADILDIPLRTLARSWRRAKAWLYARMTEDHDAADHDAAP
ncbi:MAG: ECF-type sigma factor [Acidobacteriota bacterium]